MVLMDRLLNLKQLGDSTAKRVVKAPILQFNDEESNDYFKAVHNYFHVLKKTMLDRRFKIHYVSFSFLCEDFLFIISKFK